MPLSLIVALTNDRAIGRAGDMLFHISDDLRRFKRLTMGHALIMGRRTFESLPGGALPGRLNIVVTRDADYKADGARVCHSLHEAIEVARQYYAAKGQSADVDAPGPEAEDEVFVIGGGQIYAEAIERASLLYLTEIDTTAPDADTFFPEVSTSNWKTDSAGPWQTDPRTGVSFRYTCLSRI